MLVKYTGDTQKLKKKVISFPFSDWHGEATFEKERVSIKLLAPTITFFVFINLN